MSSSPSVGSPPPRTLRSWRWMLPCAALPLLAVLLLAALGARDYIQMLTGIQPLTAAEMMLGFAYLVSNLTLKLLSPVFVLAAALIAVRDFRIRTRSER